MFFLNLTAGEFLTLLGALGGLITTLYLLDRSRRKKVVSTLRFWTPAIASEQRHTRRRVSDPWSLVLQLLSLLLLLFAIAQVQWGTRQARGHDHIILLDISSWSGEANVLAREKSAADDVIAALPANDRVMLVRADALSTPATPFTSDRHLLLRAINASTAAFSALNIDQALSFAHQARAWSGGRQGEIIYIGPQFIQDERVPPALHQLRVIPVAVDRENCGILRIGVKHGEDASNSWQAIVTLKNYGSQPRTIRLNAQFAGTVFAPRRLTLAPRQEAVAQYNFVTNVSGRLQFALQPHDALPSDDQASLELPGGGLLTIAAFTSRPAVLRPLLEANHRITAKFLAPAAYVPKPAADVMLLDQFAPGLASGSARQLAPGLPNLWIDPPANGSPLQVKAVIANAVITGWSSNASLGAGLRAKETLIPRAEVFEIFEGDQPVGSVAQGTVIAVRPGVGARQPEAVIGFDPLSGPMRFEVTTPLLFASLLRWLSPDSFRNVEITAGRVGAATITLDANERATQVHVIDERGFAVPFTLRNETLQLFAGHPSIVRVLSGDRERVLSLTLPDIAQLEWKPPANTAIGLPTPRSLVATSTDLWRWCAILGGLGLLGEWLLFGRGRLANWRRAPAVSLQPSPEQRRKSQKQERELVSK